MVQHFPRKFNNREQAAHMPHSQWKSIRIRKVYVDLYSALRIAPQMRSDMDHTDLPANYTMPAFTPQPQNITALWLVLILPSHGG